MSFKKNDAIRLHTCPIFAGLLFKDMQTARIQKLDRTCVAFTDPAASLRGLRTSPCSKRLPRPFGTSGPTPGRPASQYGGSTGVEELNSRNPSMISKGRKMCQLRGFRVSTTFSIADEVCPVPGSCGHSRRYIRSSAPKAAGSDREKGARYPGDGLGVSDGQAHHVGV